MTLFEHSETGIKSRLAQLVKVNKIINFEDDNPHKWMSSQATIYQLPHEINSINRENFEDKPDYVKYVALFKIGHQISRLFTKSLKKALA